MNKLLTTIAVFCVLTLGFMAGSQAKSMSQSGLTIYQTTQLIGLPVKSRDGVRLGKIFDLLVDSQGHMDFAIVSQPGFQEFPGRLVAVPFSSLRIWEGKSQEIHVVLNYSKEKFWEAPNWGMRIWLADNRLPLWIDILEFNLIGQRKPGQPESEKGETLIELKGEKFMFYR